MWNVEQFRKELAEIVNLDSSSENLQDIAVIGRMLANRLRDEGYLVETFDEDTRIEARTHSEKDFDVMFVGHMDTVFPKGTAAERPYREEGNLAYGPGAADMKAGLVLAMHLAKQLRAVRPELRICLAFNSDEEIGSGRSKSWLQKLARHTRYAFVFEPGRQNNGFVRSRKGGADLEVSFQGIAAHAGVAPEKGANALVEMARWITELTALQDFSAGTSITAGVAAGGTASNVVAERAEVVFDIRFKDSHALEKIREKVSYLKQNPDVNGVKAEPVFKNVIMPMNPSNVTEELMQKMNQAASGLGQSICWIDTGGVSDANHIASLGVPTLCGCGPVGNDMHSSGEYLELDTIEKRLELMYRLIVQL